MEDAGHMEHAECVEYVDIFHLWVVGRPNVQNVWKVASHLSGIVTP